MVLYTLLTYDEIFPNEEQSHELIQYMGRDCFVRKGYSGSLQIEKLLSTDPNDFLLPHLAPGTVIEQTNRSPSF